MTAGGHRADGAQFRLRAQLAERRYSISRKEGLAMGSKLGGFFRGLMGSGGSGDTGGASDAPTRGEAAEYNGYSIAPACRKQGSQWLTAGVISKPFDDGVKEHHFIRADLHASKDDAEACAVMKGKRIVDEQGDKMFDGR
jgi:hypothetical protein